MQHSPSVKVTTVKKRRPSRCRSVKSASSGLSVTRVKSATQGSAKNVEKTFVVENLDAASSPSLRKKIERPPTTVSVTHISRSQSVKSIANKSTKMMSHLQHSDKSEHCLAQHLSKPHTFVPIQDSINTPSSLSNNHQLKVTYNTISQFFDSSSVSLLKSKDAMINTSTLSRDIDDYREIYTIGRDTKTKNKKHQLCKKCSLCCFLAVGFALFLLIGIIIALPLIVISLMKTTTTTVISTTLTTVTMSNTTANLSFCWNTTGTTLAGIAGMSGIAANRFDRPFDLAWDMFNTLYISDQNNNRAQKWLMGSSTRTTIAGQSGGGSGTTLSDLDTPSGILVDS